MKQQIMFEFDVGDVVLNAQGVKMTVANRFVQLCTNLISYECTWFEEEEGVFVWPFTKRFKPSEIVAFDESDELVEKEEQIVTVE